MPKAKCRSCGHDEFYIRYDSTFFAPFHKILKVTDIAQSNYSTQGMSVTASMIPELMRVVYNEKLIEWAWKATAEPDNVSEKLRRAAMQTSSQSAGLAGAWSNMLGSIQGAYGPGSQGGQLTTPSGPALKPQLLCAKCGAKSSYGFLTVTFSERETIMRITEYLKEKTKLLTEEELRELKKRLSELFI